MVKTRCHWFKPGISSVSSVSAAVIGYYWVRFKVGFLWRLKNNKTPVSRFWIFSTVLLDKYIHWSSKKACGIVTYMS